MPHAVIRMLRQRARKLEEGNFLGKIKYDQGNHKLAVSTEMQS